MNVEIEEHLEKTTRHKKHPRRRGRTKKMKKRMSRSF